MGAREWSNKGISLHSLGRYEEAIRCYDRALELDQRFAYAWNNKGGSLHILGRDEEAIRLLRQRAGTRPTGRKGLEQQRPQPPRRGPRRRGHPLL